ncbi:MAG: hypothetical protein ABIQ27_11590 [Flavobacterium sp.]|uniref:hypothetical protein n=1 Tax=Flavobacterium sp. TaxID=239 RepID=UPI003267B1EA
MFNKEPVFDTFKPEAKEYKDKLAEKIKANDNVSYYFNRLFKKDNADYMEISVEGKDFKAVAFVFINNWKNIEGIKDANGGGYNGAELKGLQLVVIPNYEGADLVYKDLESIID